MDQRVRVAIAASVLAGGLLLALPFRHRADNEPAIPIPAASDQLVLRKSPLPAPPAAKADEPLAVHPFARVGNAAPSSVAPQVLVPQDTGNSPPEPIKPSSGGSLAGNSRWGVSLGQMLPEVKRSPAPQTYKIADGDTLSALAERFLGSADRAGEIYEANRNRLVDPRLLPIGVELQLPPRDRPAASSDVLPKRPLVPVDP